MLREKCVQQNSYVLCKVYEKSGPGQKKKKREEYGDPYEENEWEAKFDHQSQDGLANTDNFSSVSNKNVWDNQL